jgi:hypothetical protein
LIDQTTNCSRKAAAIQATRRAAHRAPKPSIRARKSESSRNSASGIFARGGLIKHAEPNKGEKHWQDIKTPLPYPILGEWCTRKKCFHGGNVPNADFSNYQKSNMKLQGTGHSSARGRFGLAGAPGLAVSRHRFSLISPPQP